MVAANTPLAANTVRAATSVEINYRHGCFDILSIHSQLLKLVLHLFSLAYKRSGLILGFSDEDYAQCDPKVTEVMRASCYF